MAKKTASQKAPDAPIELSPEATNKVLAILTGIIVVPLLFWMAMPDTPRPAHEVEAEQESINRHEAFGCAADEVRTLLRSPSSFDIDNTTTSITKTAEHMFSVTGGFDAQNGFGAMIRNNFSCSVQLTTSDRCMIADCTIY